MSLSVKRAVMLDNPLSAWSDFIAQPFGVVGAVCIMLAVTAINSQRLTTKLKTRSASGPAIFNGLNLVGGACLFTNAVIRSEIVWVVLETHFVIVAIKGLVQLQQRGPGGTNPQLLQLARRKTS